MAVDEPPLAFLPAKAGVQGNRHALAILGPSPDLIPGSRWDDEEWQGGESTGLLALSNPRRSA